MVCYLDRETMVKNELPCLRELIRKDLTSSSHITAGENQSCLYYSSIPRSYFLCDSYCRLDYRSVYIVISVAYYPLTFFNSQHLYFCLRLSLLNRSLTTGITNQKNNRDPTFYSCVIMHLLKERRPYSKKWILPH